MIPKLGDCLNNRDWFTMGYAVAIAHISRWRPPDYTGSWLSARRGSNHLFPRNDACVSGAVSIGAFSGVLKRGV